MGPGFESLKVHNSGGKVIFTADGCKDCDPASQVLHSIVGVFYAEGPPVPFPNTEVKLCRADDT